MKYEFWTHDNVTASSHEHGRRTLGLLAVIGAIILGGALMLVRREKSVQLEQLAEDDEYVDMIGI